MIETIHFVHFSTHFLGVKSGVGRKLPIHCGHLPKFGLSTSLSWMQRLVWSSALLSLGRLTQMVGPGKLHEHQRVKLFTVFSGSVTMCLLVNLPASHGLLHLWRFGGPCCNSTRCDMGSARPGGRKGFLWHSAFCHKQGNQNVNVCKTSATECAPDSDKRRSTGKVKHRTKGFQQQVVSPPCVHEEP